MEKIEVYRLEDSSGFGPFINDEGENLKGVFLPDFRGELIRLGYLSNMVSSDLDFVCLPEYTTKWSKYFCAVTSANDITDWFSQEDLNNLYSKGYQIARYTVNSEDVILADKQVFFVKEHSTKVQ